jgi:hypothetical protein
MMGKPLIAGFVCAECADAATIKAANSTKQYDVL